MTDDPPSETGASPPAVTGHASLEAVRADVGCPVCGYNLRGLRRVVVDCPECGTRCDIAELVSRRWTKPWYKAPGFNTVLIPACAAFGIVMSMPFYPVFPLLLHALVYALTSKLLHERWYTVILPVYAVAVAGAWGWLMLRAWRLFGDGRGLALAGLAHLLLVGHVVGLLAGVGGVIAIPTSLVGNRWGPAALGLLAVLAGGVVIWLCRRGERYIAEQCIRRYLRGEPRP